jgi:ribosomal protection tetracycline resistance protein
VSTLNLGILAHVDAGKTSLTERLLFDAGVIDAIGSVDDRSTQTDTLALERQRGITIKSAVVAFALGDLTVNLIDTPGHPDFIAEVERVLALLDGAILVVSAVEGVQAQTRVLMRTLQRLRIPTLIFLNKIDRVGADVDRALAAIVAKLTPAVVAMGATHRQGSPAAAVTPYGHLDRRYRSRLAEVLAEHDDRLLEAYVHDSPVPYRQLRQALAAQARSALVHPVFSGSALTGTGIATLTAGILELLPRSADAKDGPVCGTVFKVERGPAGEKIAYVRMFSGTLRPRDRITTGPGGVSATVTRIEVIQPASPARRGQHDRDTRQGLRAGQIGRVFGLRSVRIGDGVGTAGDGPAGPRRPAHFAPPTLETVVTPDRLADRARLHLALSELAEQDPLINLREDSAAGQTLLSLYGEIQKEVIQQTLADDYGVLVSFSETTTICLERPAGAGTAAKRMGEARNPFNATVGLRIEPAPAGSGITFRLGIQLGALPMAFIKAVEAAVHETLRQGLHGWQVTDCVVTLTESGYVPPPPQGWSIYSSSASDFRGLTPLVLMTALLQAETIVYEPVHAFRVEAPADKTPRLLQALTRLAAVPLSQQLHGPLAVIEGEVPAASIRTVQLQLPGLTSGEGVLETSFDHYEPARGGIPVRARSGSDPLNREGYLLRIAGWA